MSDHPHELPPMFHFDVFSDSSGERSNPAVGSDELVVELLRQLVVGQQRQNKLLEEVLQQGGAVQRQRAAELGQWKKANPKLSRRCRTAAETLSKVQNEFLERLTEEVSDNEDCLLDGEFLLNEFVDRYGPRLAHLSGVLQVLSQLSHSPNAESPKPK